METHKQTFHHSFGKLAFMFFGVLILGILAFSIGETEYFLIGLTGIVLVIALSYATSRVRISNEEITATRLLGSKSLRWSEIARISTFGPATRLHNYDDDLVLSIDSQLDGYADILNIIFSKRPDLLDQNDDPVISISWLRSILTVGAGLLLIAYSVSWFLVSEEAQKILSIFLFASGLYPIVRWFLSPKRITLESRHLIVGYILREVSYSVEDINLISLQKQKSQNGYVYFTEVNLTSGRKINLTGFRPGAPFLYHILKRWHQKAVSS